MASTAMVLGVGALGLGGLYLLTRPKHTTTVVGGGGALPPSAPLVGGVPPSAAPGSQAADAQLGFGIASGILGLIPGVVNAAGSIGGLFSSGGGASSSSDIGGSWGSVGGASGGFDGSDLGDLDSSSDFGY